MWIIWVTLLRFLCFVFYSCSSCVAILAFQIVEMVLFMVELSSVTYGAEKSCLREAAEQPRVFPLQILDIGTLLGGL